MSGIVRHVAYSRRPPAASAHRESLHRSPTHPPSATIILPSPYMGTNIGSRPKHAEEEKTKSERGPARLRVVVGTTRGASARPGKEEGGDGTYLTIEDKLPACQTLTAFTPHPLLPLPPSRSSRSEERSPRIRTARMAPSPAIRKAQALPASPALPSVALLLTADTDTIPSAEAGNVRGTVPAPGNRYNADGCGEGGGAGWDALHEQELVMVSRIPVFLHRRISVRSGVSPRQVQPPLPRGAFIPISPLRAIVADPSLPVAKTLCHPCGCAPAASRTSRVGAHAVLPMQGVAQDIVCAASKRWLIDLPRPVYADAPCASCASVGFGGTEPSVRVGKSGERVYTDGRSMRRRDTGFWPAAWRRRGTWEAGIRCHRVAHSDVRTDGSTSSAGPRHPTREPGQAWTWTSRREDTQVHGRGARSGSGIYGGGPGMT
ncbi:hypothetical protein B0H13DRAFT_2659280 [Mycena leptocephala]|nr:hypothetical protein B0H13DRAFT_2659280 [Mycena leptocephala]